MNGTDKIRPLDPAMKVKQVAAISRSLDECQKSTFRNILQCVENDVKQSAKTTGTHSCCVRVPAFMYGAPLYSLDECIQYIMRKLSKKGFSITHLYDAMLLISWEHATKKTKKPKRDRPTEQVDETGLQGLTNIRKVAGGLQP